MERLDFSEELDRYFEGVLFAIRSGYSTTEEADREEAKIKEALAYERVNILFSNDMGETASRRSVAHLAAIGLHADRHSMRAINPDIAEKIDGMIHHALKLGEHMFGMGGSPIIAMGKAIRNDIAQAQHSAGGKSGNETRTEWQVEARVRYDRFIAKHPEITAAAGICRGILKEAIPDAPSDDRVYEVICGWRKSI